MNFKKGSIYLMIAWAVALVTGYLYNIWLTHRFSQSVYGDYQVIISVLVWLEIVVLHGLPYTIQKFIGSHEEQADAILLTAIYLQLWVAVLLFILSYAAAPWIARALKSVNYTMYLRVAFCDVLFLGFYNLLQAYQNGQQQFGRQSMMIVLYVVGKLAAGVLLVLIFGSLISALLANIVASILGILWGIVFLGRRSLKIRYPARPLLRFTRASLGFLLMLYLLFYIDLWFVKVHLHSAVSGYYGLAGMLSRAPYFLCIGVATTMLPTLSAALTGGELDQAKHLFRQAIQFLWLMLAPIGVLMVIFRNDIISILFKAEYAPAAPVMAVLLWGMIALAFFYLNTTLLNAAHKPRLSFFLVGAMILLDVALNAVYVPRYGVMGGAVSTSFSCFLGMMVSAVLVFRRFRVALSAASFLRITGVAAGVGILAILTGLRGIWAIPAIIVGIVLYLAILFWWGELSRRDIEEIFGGGR